MEDIISKIDEALERIEKEKSVFILRENVLKVIDLIIQDIPEDKVYLESMRYFLNKNWNSYNEEVREQFDNILSYYGIKENKQIEKKMIVEKRGNTFVRRTVRLSNYNIIKGLLG